MADRTLKSFSTDLVLKNCEYVICPEVTLCTSWDTKIPKLTDVHVCTIFHYRIFHHLSVHVNWCDFFALVIYFLINQTSAVTVFLIICYVVKVKNYATFTGCWLL